MPSSCGVSASFGRNNFRRASSSPAPPPSSALRSSGLSRPPSTAPDFRPAGRSPSSLTCASTTAPDSESRPQTVRDLAVDPKAARDGQVVAVDQIPCETCAPKLASELPAGSKVVVPKVQGGEPPALPGQKQPAGTSPKQAAKKAAAGRAEVNPYTVMTTPRSPAQVGRRTSPTGGLVLWPAFRPDRKDDKGTQSVPPPQADRQPPTPILQFTF